MSAAPMAGKTPAPMAKEPGIKVTADGPYEVRSLPVAAGRIERTARGEAIEWDVDEPYEAGRLVLLCRCGRSKTKPFCDDSHLEGFDGTEVADRGPTADRRESFLGGGLTLTDDQGLCSHAGFCRDRLSNVWDRMETIEDPEVRAKEESTVVRCPSGRSCYSARTPNRSSRRSSPPWWSSPTDRTGSGAASPSSPRTGGCGKPGTA